MKLGMVDLMLIARGNEISTKSGPPVAIQLLRTCLRFCKFVYVARTAPPSLLVVAGPLQHCDNDIRDCFSKFAAMQISERAWSQAQLSVTKGGLGLRSVSKHCAPAFISSHTKAIPDLPSVSGNPGP